MTDLTTWTNECGVWLKRFGERLCVVWKDARQWHASIYRGQGACSPWEFSTAEAAMARCDKEYGLTEIPCGDGVLIHNADKTRSARVAHSPGGSFQWVCYTDNGLAHRSKDEALASARRYVEGGVP